MQLPLFDPEPTNLVANWQKQHAQVSNDVVYLLPASIPETRSERRAKLKMLATTNDNWNRSKPVTQIGSMYDAIAYPNGDVEFQNPIRKFIDGKLTPIYTYRQLDILSKP